MTAAHPTSRNRATATGAGPAHAPVLLRHDIPLDLAGDTALADLLDNYPADLFDINRYTFDADGQVSLATGERGQCDGATLLEAVRRGELWVNMRGVEHAHPELWAHVMRSFEAMKPDVGGRGARRATGQLILSSPTTKVPFHFDAAGVVLFHLRGRKRIWIYPNTDAFLPQAAMEQVVMRTTTEELPYARSYDGDARVFDLAPGEAVSWPLYAPHRVENLDGPCVSISMDFQTWGSRITTGAHCANGVRRQWGMKPAAMAATPMPVRAGLWAASVAMKKAGLVKNRIKHFERSFDVGDVAPPNANGASGSEPLRAA